MKISKGKTTRICSLLSITFCSLFLAVISSDGLVSSWDTGAPTTPGSCSGGSASSDKMKSFLKEQNACMRSGVGWIKYTFTDDFKRGLAYYNDTGKIVKRDAEEGGGIVYYDEISGGKYKNKNVSLLTLDKITFGPGSPGNGDALRYSSLTTNSEGVSESADACRQDGDGIYRSGYFEAKDNAFSYNIPGVSSSLQTVYPGAPSDSAGSVKHVGITGHQSMFSYEGGSRKISGNYCARYVGNGNGGTENCDYNYGQTMTYVNSSSTLSIDQRFYYDGVELFSATGSNAAYNYDDKTVVEDYVKSLAKQNDLSDAEAQEILDKLGSYSGNNYEMYTGSINSYSFSSQEVKKVAEQVWKRWGVAYAWCYNYKAKPKEATYHALPKVQVYKSATEVYGYAAGSGANNTVEIDYDTSSFKVDYLVYDIIRSEKVDNTYAVTYHKENYTLGTDSGDFTDSKTYKNFYSGRDFPIAPGETVEVCLSIDYNAHYANGAFDTPTHAKACVKVYRPKYSAKITSRTGAQITYNGAGQSINEDGTPNTDAACLTKMMEAKITGNTLMQTDYSLFPAGSDQDITKKCIIDSPDKDFTAFFYNDYTIGPVAKDANYNKDKNGNSKYESFDLSTYGSPSASLGDTFPTSAFNFQIKRNPAGSDTNYRLFRLGTAGASALDKAANDTSIAKEQHNLRPQEKYTFKQTFKHPEYVTTDDGTRVFGNKQSSATYEVTRAGLKCADSFKPTLDWARFGVEKGENIASLGVVRTRSSGAHTWYLQTAGSNPSSNTNLTVLTTNGTYLPANIWTKPGDFIKFSDDLCAGAQYAANANGHSDWVNSYYTLATNKAYYLFGNQIQDVYKPDTSVTVREGGAHFSWKNQSFLRFTNGEKNTNDDNAAKYYSAVGVTSPSNGTNYRCNGLSTSYDGYCISGGEYSDYNKNFPTIYASMKAVMSKDVGSEFSHSISFQYAKYEGGNGFGNGSVTDRKDATYVANIKTPYNYVAQPNISSSSNSSYVTAGSTYKGSVKVNVSGRANVQVDGSNAYSTQTKKSRVVILGFTTDAKANQINENTKFVHIDGDTPNISQICEQAISGGSIKDCQNAAKSETNFTTAIDESSKTISSDAKFILDQNDIIDEDGDAVGVVNANYEVPAEGETIGNKVCLVAAIWPADSHDNPFASEINSEDQSKAFGDGNSSSYWAISAPTCNTISKQPTFSVEGGSLFVAGDINVSTPLTSMNIGGSIKDVRGGSWVEYGLMQGGSNNGLASGAGLGYRGNSINGLRSRNNQVAVKMNESLNNGRTLYKNINAGDALHCSYATQTFSNEDCSDSFGDNVNSAVLSQTQARLSGELDELREEYATKELNEGAGATSLGAMTSYSNDFCLGDNPDGGSQYFCTPSGEAYFSFAGDVTIGNKFIAKGTDKAGRKNTVVIRTDHDVIINNNIEIEDKTYTGIKSVPQVLIFADNVKIDASVTRIDAWIIASGTVNTCYKDGGTIINDVKDLSVDKCNNTLVFNGPVAAGNIVLNRTAGGGTENGSSSYQISPDNYTVRAEIFNLSNLTYYWLEWQLESKNGLTTTSLRELPARY